MEVPCKKKCGINVICKEADRCHDWLEFVLRMKADREEKKVEIKEYDD